MNVDVGIWGKLTRLILFLFVIAVIMGVAATYYPLLKQNERMRSVVYQLDVQVQQAEMEQRQMRTTIDSMSKDPATVERLVRERLGYARPGETVIRFEELH
jgi:cell division protein FtsB